MMRKIVQLKKDNQGFTLVELMIVVAIIGILAAIAIPQFAAYRVRSQSTAAQSDVRNVKTGEAAMFTDYSTYGQSAAGPAAGFVAAGGAGAVVQGPLIVSLTPLTAVATAVSFDYGLSNQVELQVDTNALATDYSIIAKHQGGTRVFGADEGASQLYFVEQPAAGPTWSGLLIAGTAVAMPPPTGVPTDFLPLAAAAGWSVL